MGWASFGARLNEFKMQMDDELRQSEQADRLKKIEAMEAAAPVTTAALPREDGGGRACFRR